MRRVDTWSKGGGRPRQQLGWVDPTSNGRCSGKPRHFRCQIAVAGGEESFEIFRLDSLGDLNLPYTHRVLLENLLRTEDGANVTADQIRALAAWDATAAPTRRSSSPPLG